MFSILRKHLLALAAISSLTSMTSLAAWDSWNHGNSWDYGDSSFCCEQPSCNRFYIGAFGGGIYSTSSHVHQEGTALFPEVDGGPLAVEAHGRLEKRGTGFGGIQIGYEWTRDSGCGWNISPAAEIEAFWFSHKKHGHLINSTDTDRLPEHDFLDSFHVNSGVYLVNAVFSFNNNCWCLTPYVGVGIGATRISLHHADSLQVDPEEPGVNHFNSRRNDSSWAFAAQAKAGLRYNLTESIHLFGEYRYLFVDSSNFRLGSTVYADHARTTPWNVRFKNIQYNAFAFGIQFDL